MHVVIANRWYPTETGSGGVSIYNQILAHGLIQHGARVTVVTVAKQRSLPGVRFDGEVVLHCLEGISLSRVLKKAPILNRYSRVLEQSLYSVRVARHLRELFKRDRYEVVEFAEINAEAYAWLRSLRMTPTIVRCHTSTSVLKRYYTASEMRYDTRVITHLEHECIRMADAITAPSNDMASTVSTLADIPRHRIKVIPNPVSCKYKENRRPRRKEQPITVLHVGRLDRVKGVEVLARAIGIITKVRQDVEFVFIGQDMPGPGGRSQLEELTKILRRSDSLAHVRFLGHADENQLAKAYVEAHIVVVPALIYESFSYTCAQAMSYALPVVASRIGGIPETVGDTGILVEPGTPASLADALLLLITDQGLREALGEAARARIEKLMDADKVVRSTLEFYQTLASC